VDLGEKQYSSGISALSVFLFLFFFTSLYKQTGLGGKEDFNGYSVFFMCVHM
jgi:hypothetical protein